MILRQYQIKNQVPTDLSAEALAKADGGFALKMNSIST
jgi:hypothetical protein